VTPSNIDSTRVELVYLLDPAGVIHVLGKVTAVNGRHSFPGLGRFGLLASTAVAETTEADALMRNVNLDAVLGATFRPTGWGTWTRAGDRTAQPFEQGPDSWSTEPGEYGAIERKVIADELARVARRRRQAVNAFRSECRGQFESLVAQRLQSNGSPIVVRYGISPDGYEVSVNGLKFWFMRCESPSGSIELATRSGASTRIDQAQVLSELSSTDSSLRAAVQAISTKRGSWLLELLAWFRQEVAPDPIQQHLPAEELRHADGRAWSVEVLQTERGGDAGRSRSPSSLPMPMAMRSSARRISRPSMRPGPSATD
jgi:hypothetical protein